MPLQCSQRDVLQLESRHWSTQWFISAVFSGSASIRRSACKPHSPSDILVEKVDNVRRILTERLSLGVAEQL